VPASPVPARRLVVLLVITALALMTIDVRGIGPLDRAREGAIAATRPVREVASRAASPLVDGWRGAVHHDDLVAENAELRRRLAELEGRLDRAPDAEVQLAELLRATGLTFAGDLAGVTARVASDRRTGLERVVEIDKGSDHGLAVGMPVVTGAGLVGRLELVAPRSAVVRLVSDPTINVGVRSSSGVVGVARGAGDGQPLVLELPDGSAGLAGPGERFRTIGSARSVYPPDIPVGRLVGEPGIEGDLRLDPVADLDRLHHLTVLVWEPER
jgi:rod shape-determining protein MreC